MPSLSVDKAGRVEPCLIVYDTLPGLGNGETDLSGISSWPTW
jgi:hypothetical protein